MKKNILQNVLNFPLTKIMIGFIVWFAANTFGEVLFAKVLDLSALSKDVRDLIVGILASIVTIVSYVYLFKFYEKRKIKEFSGDQFLKSLTIGIILGFLLQGLTIFVIYLKGGYSVLSINPILFLVPSLTMAITSGITEEVLMRGILFRIIEEKLGSYIALIISAILFGAAHLFNENASLIGAVAIALEAGVLLAAAYIYSRNLWFPIGIHFAWNFAQSGIFGAAVSGNGVLNALFNSKIEGATWFTGGLFGPEGSVQAVVICSIAAIVMLVLSHKQGKIIKPYWKKL